MVLKKLWILLYIFLMGCGPGNHQLALNDIQNAEQAGLVADQSTESPTNKKNLARKLIYSARVEVETVEFERFSQALVKEVENWGGVLSNYSDERTSGDLRSGKWTVRLPSNQFNIALDWLDSTTTVIRKQVKSQDITEEFIDLEARLQNKRNTEQRLKVILDEKPGKLDEVLSVEREMARVREEIERVEGRLRLVKDQIALSTIEITVNTREKYIAKEVTLEQKVKEAWDGSLRDLKSAGESFVVTLVRWVPKLPVLAAILYAGWLLFRFLVRKKTNGNALVRD